MNKSDDIANIVLNTQLDRMAEREKENVELII